jgi:hypothetical protein
LVSRVGYPKWDILSLHGGLFLVVVGVQGGVPEVGLRLGVENGLHLLKHLLQHREILTNKEDADLDQVLKMTGSHI